MKVFVAALLFVSFACVYGTPIEPAAEPIAPMFNAVQDVRIRLQTRQNRLDPQTLNHLDLASVQRSHFNRDRPTRILIHGWLEDEGSDISTATSAELLLYYDFNVIFIDWSAGARTINYIGATNRVEPVGSVVAQNLDFWHQNGYIDFSRLSIVGFSLGAHVAGHTGKLVRRGRINTIIGLDPAGPLFSTRRPDGRLDRNDAVYVEGIHTNGPTLLIAGAGIGFPIGHADFWPNGGSSQPGCITNTCSHGRAVDFYVESIRVNGFFGLGCREIDDISSRRCNIQPGEWMGGDGVRVVKTGRGSFLLDTRRSSPYALGPNRPAT